MNDSMELFKEFVRKTDEIMALKIQNSDLKDEILRLNLQLHELKDEIEMLKQKSLRLKIEGVIS